MQTGLVGSITEKEEILEKVRLNWTVRAEGLKSINTNIEVPKQIGIFRDDNNAWLGTHMQSYVPYQNHELLELLYRIGHQTGLQLHSGGYFGNGEKVWLQLKSDDLKLPGGDMVKGYLSTFNSFDGKTSLAFGNCNFTVSCQNTFWRGYKEVESKFRHSSMMRDRIEEVLMKIDLLLAEEQKTFKQIEHLVDVRMNSAVKELVVRALFDIDKDSRLDDPDMSTNKKNKIDRFYLDLDREVNQKGDNLWGLFSGVTRYTTHSMKKGDNSESKIFGMTGQRERAIWNELVHV